MIKDETLPDFIFWTRRHYEMLVTDFELENLTATKKKVGWMDDGFHEMKTIRHIFFTFFKVKM